MLKSKVLLLLFLCVSSTEFSFSQLKDDSIRLELIDVEPFQITLTPWTPFPFPNPYPEVITWPELPPYSFEWPLTLTIALPECGETFHSNGKIASRISCENGKFHGKSVFWDEKGRKTAIQVHNHGKLILNKSYDTLGRLFSSATYDIKGRLHGENISVDYNYENKTIDGYTRGIRKYHKEFQNKLITLYETYTNDTLHTQTRYRSSGIPYQFVKYHGVYIIQNTEYYENGNLFSEELSDSIGRPLSLRTWDEHGILTSEKKWINGLIEGEFLENYNPTTHYKKVSYYDKGIPLKTNEYEQDRLTTEIFYKQGRHDYTVSWFPNGDTLWLFTSGNINHQKKWNEDRKIIQNFYYNSSNQFVGNSYYSHNDTSYYIVAEPLENAQVYFMRWTVFKGDTIRQDFMNNQVSLIWNNNGSYLASNYFIKDPNTGKYVKNGIWKYYNGNSLSHTTTYVNGKRQGLAIFYDLSTAPKKASEGYFDNDLRTGEWITYSDSGNRYITYTLGKETGPFRYFFPNDSLRISGTRLNGENEGEYSEYFENGVLKQTLIFKNGKMNCYRKLYDEHGRIQNEGTIVDNTASGKWYFYTYDDHGNQSREKLKYSRVKIKKGVA